jgi:tetratricopeptide (TPR) repeat protein
MNVTVPPRARRGLGALMLVALLAAAWTVLGTPAGDRGSGDRSWLLALLKTGQYERLELHLAKLHAGYERGERGEAELENAYAAFASADPALQARLDAWLNRLPRSFTALLARGEYYRHLARISRRNAGQAADDGAPARAYLARARRALEAAIDRTPRLGIGYAGLIAVAMAANAPDRADYWFAMGLEADPGTAAVRRAYLLSLRPWRRPDEDAVALMARLHALTELHGVSQHAPDLAALRGFHAYVTAELLRRQRRHDQAARYYRDALAQGPDWLYLRGAGMNALQSAEAVAAIGYFSEALERRPQDPALLDWRAHALLSLGDDDDALADWRLALSVDPANPDILYGYGHALRELGKAELAAEVIDAAPDLARNNPRLRSLRGSILLADLNRPYDAVAELRSAVTLDPQSGESWRAFAEALYIANDCEGAARAIVTYQSLCADGTKCTNGDLTWADRTLRETRDPDLCPVYGILGP